MRIHYRLLAASAAVLGAALLFTSACSKSTRPYNHPHMGIYDRNASRIQLVPLIISDEKRAAIVQANYIEIEKLVKERERLRTAALNELTTLSSNYALPEKEVREIVSRFSQGGSAAFKKYVQIQMEIREHTSEEEFARLDGVR